MAFTQSLRVRMLPTRLGKPRTIQVQCFLAETSVLALTLKNIFLMSTKKQYFTIKNVQKCFNYIFTF